MHPTRTVQLIPRRSPDRRVARARAFQSEIVRLYVGGYTCEAIREALADAGVDVSESTVRRELARQRDPQPAPTPADRNATSSSKVQKSPGLPLSIQGDPRTGKEIAEDFFKTHISNPLLRAKGRTD